MLICSGLARPNSSTTMLRFDWKGDGSNRDYAMEHVVTFSRACEKDNSKQLDLIIFFSSKGKYSAAQTLSHVSSRKMNAQFARATAELIHVK